MTEGERAAALADFSVMTEAVVGGSPGGPFTFDELTRAVTSGDGPRVSAAPGVVQRDEAAYQLLGLGYSARETADVVSGRISQQALDTAQRMIAVGAGAMPRRLSRHAVPDRARSRTPRSLETRAASSSAFDGFIEHYARLHQVEAGSCGRSCRPSRRSTRPPARTPAPSA